VLQQRLEELRRPSDVSQIALLVMKVAREFFERGLLMLVKDEELRGLGGFGPSGHDDPLHLEAREIAIPLDEPSLFLEVVLERRSHYGRLPDDRLCESFLERIGRHRSRSVALLPLLAHRETIAVLFGDNPRSGRDPSGTDALEVFIQQAGIALENAFLQRKLQALQQQAPG
jgi:GAF domain-containing protein